MAKWNGIVGYVDTVDQGNGIWEETVICEQRYFGDVVNPSMRYRGAEKLNDDLVTTDKISLLADAFALANFSKIRYAEYMGDFWKVEHISISRPRLVLTLGGVYNGPTSTSSRRT